MKTKLHILLVALSQVGFVFGLQDHATPGTNGRDGGAHAQQDERFKGAANAWMLVPVDLHNQHDDVADANRRARDAYWDNVIGSRVPLSEPGARLRDLPAADMLFQFPVEIPNPFDGYVLVIGRVGGYKTLLSSTERSVYTELEFRVETILGGPDIPLLRKDQVISIGRAGGTIIAPWGRLESYVRTPEKYDFSPGRTYFIAAGYHANGDFYTMHGIQRRWDLTDGTVVPDSPIEVARAQRGLAQLAGLSRQELIDA